MAKQYLLKEGIPENAVLLEEQSAITQENLEYSLKIMNENNLKTALIISDPYHMKRAMLPADNLKRLFLYRIQMDSVVFNAVSKLPLFYA